MRCRLRRLARLEQDRLGQSPPDDPEITDSHSEGGKERLQRLLAHSTSSKLLAVRRVTENHGRKTAGVDRVRWPTPESKSCAVRTLGSKGYRALPLRRVHIPKSHGGGTRPLGIPTMRDRAIRKTALGRLPWLRGARWLIDNLSLKQMDHIE